MSEANDLFADSPTVPKTQAKAIPDLQARREEILRLARAKELPTIEPFPAQGMPGMVNESLIGLDTAPASAPNPMSAISQTAMNAHHFR